MSVSAIVRVAVPAPLPQLFDYLPPSENRNSIPVGCRVLVPFGKSQRVGIVVARTTTSPISREKLKPVISVLDHQPVLNKELLDSLYLASAYYHHPLGIALESALPVSLRKNKPLPEPGSPALALQPTGYQQVVSGRNKKGARTTQLLEVLETGAKNYTELDELLPGWRTAALDLRKRGWIDIIRVIASPPLTIRLTNPPLNTDQQTAVTTIFEAFENFVPFLLEGITGSGKTEVYLALIEKAVKLDQQSLVLVPEIGLTPQLLRRFRERLPCPVYALHSGLSDQERTLTWLAAARGEAQVILGTRSAVFVPLPKPGLIIVDEEHDSSYKQQEGFRYHARDFALMRAKTMAIPVVLGSATPALETLANVESRRYRHLKLHTRPGAARLPDTRIIDVRGKSLQSGLSAELVQAIRHCLDQGEQALIFKNRRGYAPVWLCHDCGWHASCSRCDKPLTLHQQSSRLRCHHCDKEQPVPKRCPECQSTQLQPQGHGTERLEEALKHLFPEVLVLRIDRETTRKKGALEQLLSKFEEGQPGILVGTQMLAKGHDLPHLTLVGIVGVDEGLFSVDFRAAERLAQLVVQVSGRAGRALKPGTVWLQTHHPDHPFLQLLIQRGYSALAQQLLNERQAAGFPPYTHLALLRAESSFQPVLDEFLTQAVEEIVAPTKEKLTILGPLPAPMPRRAGRYRGQILLISPQRRELHLAIERWLIKLYTLKLAKRVRWSLDVDPLDLY